MIIKMENEFEVSENRILGLSSKKIGEQFKGIINYEAIEKTKSYTLLRVKAVTLIKTKRSF